MAQDRFLIAPLKDGLQNNLKAWLIADDAYETMNNVYLFRGRVRKRFGTNYMGQNQFSSRLRVQLPGVVTAGTFVANTITAIATAVPAIGQAFSVGTQMFTVYQMGTPALMYSSDGVAVGTYNTTTGALSITNAAAYNGLPVYYYPALPVMGLTQFNVDAINQEFSIAFDTASSYQYLSTGWNRLSGEATAGASVWRGNNTNFFWSCNYTGPSNGVNLLYTTNNFFDNAATPLPYDGIRFYNADNDKWDFLYPQYSDTATDIVVAALIVVPFQNRLLLFNIIEQSGSGPYTYPRYVNRMRASAVLQDPTVVTNWNTQTPGLGFVEDCPVTESVVSVEFVKNRLIVFMENSTWEIAYTGNEAQPFKWQQLNTEFGSESPFSVVPFDKHCLTIGNRGILSCNGSNVERIDEKIPNEVFKVLNGDDGIIRVQGIRDYFAEMVYWTYPSEENGSPYPEKILVYNYTTGSWAFNDDSITAFGYFQNPTSLTWAEANMTWDDALFNWVNPSFQSGFRQVIGGNQEGYTFIIATDEASSQNAAALQITNISFTTATMATVTCISHNLKSGEYIYIQNCVGVTNVNGKIFQVFGIPPTNDTFIIIAAANLPFSGTYAGLGTIARVSQINIVSKQYNFYLEQGRNAYISKVDFLVNKTDYGEFTVDVFASSSPDYSLITNGKATGALLGTSVVETYPYALYPYEQEQERLWHSLYLQAEGNCVQFQIYQTQEQLMNPLIAFEDFQLHAFMITAQKTTNRLQ